ncbi:hypothetical protein [Maribacter algicola]|nr:hypothetical protein [Maribacter algicola]
MKNKRTFLASLALGFFLLAMTAPIITPDDATVSVDRSKIRVPGRQ